MPTAGFTPRTTPLVSAGATRQAIVEWCTTWVDGTHWFPLTEAADGLLIGPGHQDKAGFAQAVYDFDRLTATTGLVPIYTPDDVVYDWVQVDPDGTTLHPCGADAVGAVPVTTLWRTG